MYIKTSISIEKYILLGINNNNINLPLEFFRSYKFIRIWYLVIL